MRVLDATLALLGLVAVGLVLSSLPPEEAWAKAPDDGRFAAEAALELEAREFASVPDAGPALPLKRLREAFERGLSARETGLGEPEQVRESGAAGCCMRVDGTFDEDRRRRFLERLLLPLGDGPEAARERARFEQLLQSEGLDGRLWSALEREIS